MRRDHGGYSDDAEPALFFPETAAWQHVNRASVQLTERNPARGRRLPQVLNKFAIINVRDEVIRRVESAMP